MLNFLKTKTFKVGTFVFALALGFALSASAFYDFGSTTLRVGSKGPNVMTLQTLVGANVDGDFGPMTKAAVATWQAANGLAADGVFGPLSMAKANSGTTPVVSGALCPNGNLLSNNCAAATTTPATGTLCPNGNLLSNNCAAATTTVVSNGEGSLTLSYDATPADNLAVSKGEAKDVMDIKVKATGSDMTVNRVWLDVDQRIWLYADSMSLLDGSTVLTTLPLSSSTVEEVTVGSAYTIKLNGLNFVVPVGTTKILTVRVNRPTLTTSSGAVNVAATSTLRAVDTAGNSDTYTITARILNFATTTAATGTMTNTLSSTSPAAQSVSGLSTTAGATTAVKLMDFDLKATDGLVNVTAVTGTLATTSGSTCTVAQCVSSVELRDGSSILSSTGAAVTTNFTALNIDVPAGTTKTLSIWGIMNHIASSYVVKGDGITAAITATTGTSGASYTAANTSNTVTGYTQYLFQYAPTFALVNTTAYPTSATQVDESTSGSSIKSGNYKVSFSVTAPAGSDIYVSMPSNIIVQAYTATPTVPGVSKFDATYGGTLSVSSYDDSGTTTGSVATTYQKVASGTTRYFTINGYVPHGGTDGDVGMKVQALQWNASDAVTGYTIQTWGLESLKTTKVRLNS